MMPATPSVNVAATDPESRPCCAGNLFAVQGTSPWRCSSADCAAAMGVDEGHMPYERLAQAVPPAYAQLVFLGGES